MEAFKYLIAGMALHATALDGVERTRDEREDDRGKKYDYGYRNTISFHRRLRKMVYADRLFVKLRASPTCIL